MYRAIHVHVVTMHEYKTIMMTLIVNVATDVRQITVYLFKLARSVAHVIFSVVEFVNF